MICGRHISPFSLMKKIDSHNRREALAAAYGRNDFFGSVHLEVIETLLAHQEGATLNHIAKETGYDVARVRKALSDLHFGALIENPSSLLNKSIEENVRRFRAVLPMHLAKDMEAEAYRLVPDQPPSQE